LTDQRLATAERVSDAATDLYAESNAKDLHGFLAARSRVDHLVATL